MAYATDPDPLCYSGTTVLRNLLDIEEQEALDEAEHALFLTRADEPVPSGELDIAHYRALHRHLFQDVYAWAGQFRTIRIAKGGNWFCYPEYIEPQMVRIFSALGDPDQLHRLTAAEFSAHVGHFLAELNAVHPFRDGNGRTQLAFFAMLAEHAGLDFNADRLEPDRVLDAMIRSFSGDEGPLVALLCDLVG